MDHQVTKLLQRPREVGSFARVEFRLLRCEISMINAAEKKLFFQKNHRERVGSKLFCFCGSGVNSLITFTSALKSFSISVKRCVKANAFLHHPSKVGAVFTPRKNKSKRGKQHLNQSNLSIKSTKLTKNTSHCWRTNRIKGCHDPAFTCLVPSQMSDNFEEAFC